MKEISIYCHVPFCATICGYCDFCKVPLDLRGEKGRERAARFGELVRREVELRGDILRATVPKSIFFGGGTPSLMESEFFSAFINKITQLTSGFDDNCEITVEANPDTISEFSKLEGLKNAGINRISIGVQSFDESVLKTLGRFHNPENVERAVDNCKKLGLNFSIDLIYGTPGETLISWENTLRKAISLNPEHISCYALTLENGVRMSAKIQRGDLEQVDEDLQAEMYHIADTILADSGFEWYETSNWAKSIQARSVHNLSYWHNYDWLGVGPSAHSHIGKTRFWNESDVEKWERALENNAIPPSDSEKLNSEQIKLERAMMSARLREPISEIEWGKMAISELIKGGLIDAKMLLLTLKGRLLGDEVTRILFNNTATITQCPHFQKTSCRSCPQCIVN